MMLRHNVHHIVVMDDGKIKGMISALEFVKLVAKHALG
jgi:signal-transduction protein with cAMP-binding, CBS, and nucleotidyltransferase domain